MVSKKRGFFISLEGPDGAGKSTQFGFLSKQLKKAGFSVKETREPGGHPLAEKIRSLLLAVDNQNLASETELLLFLAARAQHVRDVIQPALNHNQIVLCERFSDSTYAYQVGGRELPARFVKLADQFATQGVKPDLTLLYDITPTAGLRRALLRKQGHDRIESESIRFQQQVRKAYLQLAKQEPKRIQMINASVPLDQVTKKSWQVIVEQLPRMKRRCHVI